MKEQDAAKATQSLADRVKLEVSALDTLTIDLGSRTMAVLLNQSWNVNVREDRVILYSGTDSLKIDITRRWQDTTIRIGGIVADGDKYNAGLRVATALIRAVTSVKAATDDYELIATAARAEAVNIISDVDAYLRHPATELSYRT